MNRVIIEKIGMHSLFIRPESGYIVHSIGTLPGVGLVRQAGVEPTTSSSGG